MVSEEDVRAISSFTDEEFRQAMRRTLDSPHASAILSRYFRGVPMEVFRKNALALQSPSEFQHAIISPLIQSVLDQSSGGISLAGVEKNPPEKRYLYISNHRDIVLDPSLFVWSISFHGYGIPKICLGDNLLADPFVADLAKMNKGITVKRNLEGRELLRWSIALSELIRRQITQGIDSVWIAQSGGRAKDGNDFTHPGLVKMIALSGTGTFRERLQALHLVPVSISYEFEPCDLILAREVHLTSKDGNYQKSPEEDRQSMALGILAPKGRIHIEVGSELSWDTIPSAAGKTEQAKAIADYLDRQIQQNFRLWPSHYVAYDTLERGSAFSAHYTEEEKAAFLGRMEKGLGGLGFSDADRDGTRQRFLELYANPVRNALRWRQV